MPRSVHIHIHRTRDGVVGFTNGFKPISALRRAAQDPRVEEIEGNGMDPGRVFIHLKAGYNFMGEGRTRSVGSAAALADAMRTIEKTKT